MGLLDYYRQFDDMSESEVNAQLRERRAREKAQALEYLPVLDLSSTEWPEMPNADVVSASVYQARRRLNDYPDHYATAIRRSLAERHYMKADQIVLGNGAIELMQSAVYLLISEGDELVTPWPSYQLYPTLAARAGGRAVAVDLVAGAIDCDAVLNAVTPRTRVLIVCNPNDPTGTYLEAGRLGELLARLPEHVHVLLDEAYIQFQDAEDEDTCMGLVEAFPRLLVFRTFSKIYGLSGVRGGYVVGSPAAASMLAALAPVRGVNALTQAAVAQALRVGDREVTRRREDVIAERHRLMQGLAALRIEAPLSQANFVWMKAPGLTGEELANRLEQNRVLVAHGGPLGDEQHVRAAVRSQATTDRLLWAVEQALG
jgi:histidinol-phosphate aminotransferase